MAINFNGVDQSATKLGSYGSVDDSRSSYCWLKIPNGLAKGYPFSLGDQASDYQFSILVADNAGTAEAQGRLWTAGSTFSGASAFSYDQWVPVLITWDLATDTISVYSGAGDTAPTSATNPSGTGAGNVISLGCRISESGVAEAFYEGSLAIAREWKRLLTAGEISTLMNATSLTDVNSVSATSLQFSDDLIGTSDEGMTLGGSTTPTINAESPFSGASTPTITDIDGDESVYPGQSYIIQATDDIGATQGTVFWERLDGTDDVQHTVTNWDEATDQITVTAVRGGHNYGSGLYQARVVLGDGTTEILFDNAGSGLTLEAEPGTFAVTAASPNTTDDASLWADTVDTATGDPATVENGDQFWVNSTIPGLTIDPTGAITANETGTFTGQFWKASEGVWGSDQTVSFTLPAEATDNWPFGKAINPIATKNWTWGSRHPMTGMRVRIFK